MKALSILDEVVRELEQDINLARIKRLMLFACQQSWENDPSVLDQVDLRDLIQELRDKYTSLEDIEVVLNSVVAKVNKKAEYALVATAIIGQISRLCAEETTEGETTLSRAFDYQVPTYFEPDVEEQNGANGDSNYTPKKELFAVREKILQQTNPLRAKILIFSTLYQEFTFSDRDWALLKGQELDILLRQLLAACPTLRELESRLYTTAGNLNHPDENAQAASVIIQALSPCYTEAQPEANQREVLETAVYEETHLMRTTFEETQMSNGDLSYFEDGEITMVAQGLGGNFFYPSPISELIPSAEEELDQDEGDATCDLSRQPPPTYEELEPVDRVRHGLDDHRIRNSYQVPGIGFNISDSIKQKLGLEEEIQDLVSQSTNAVTSEIERTLSELEFELNKQVAGEPIEEQLLLKYKALRNFVGNVQTFSNKLVKILSELELKEKQRLNLDEKDSELESRGSGAGAGQPKVIDLARQGNPKAIASFLNHFLQPKGIQVTALVRESCLHIVLESSQLPNQQTTASFVQKKLASLKSPSLNAVKIHGRVSGSKSVSWTQELSKGATQPLEDH